MNILMMVLAAFVVLFIFVVTAFHLFGAYAHRMIMQLPWLKWLTYEQVRKMGYSAFMCKGVLPVYHKHGYVETRVLTDLSEEDSHYAEVLGFTSVTIESFEFRLTKRGGRRRPGITTLFQSLVPALQPARA